MTASRAGPSHLQHLLRVGLHKSAQPRRASRPDSATHRPGRAA